MNLVVGEFGIWETLSISDGNSGASMMEALSPARAAPNWFESWFDSVSMALATRPALYERWTWGLYSAYDLLHACTH